MPDIKTEFTNSWGDYTKQIGSGQYDDAHQRLPKDLQPTAKKITALVKSQGFTARNATLNAIHNEVLSAIKAEVLNGDINAEKLASIFDEVVAKRTGEAPAGTASRPPTPSQPPPIMPHTPQPAQRTTPSPTMAPPPAAKEPAPPTPMSTTSPATVHPSAQSTVHSSNADSKAQAQQSPTSTATEPAKQPQAEAEAKEQPLSREDQKRLAEIESILKSMRLSDIKSGSVRDAKSMELKKLMTSFSTHDFEMLPTTTLAKFMSEFHDAFAELRSEQWGALARKNDLTEDLKKVIARITFPNLTTEEGCRLFHATVEALVEAGNPDLEKVLGGFIEQFSSEKGCLHPEMKRDLQAKMKYSLRINALKIPTDVAIYNNERVLREYPEELDSATKETISNRLHELKQLEVQLSAFSVRGSDAAMLKSLASDLKTRNDVLWDDTQQTNESYPLKQKESETVVEKEYQRKARELEELKAADARRVAEELAKAPREGPKGPDECRGMLHNLSITDENVIYRNIEALINQKKDPLEEKSPIEKFVSGLTVEDLGMLWKFEAKSLGNNPDSRLARLEVMLPLLSDSQLKASSECTPFLTILKTDTKHSFVAAKSLTASQLGIIAAASKSIDQIELLSALIGSLGKEEDKTSRKEKLQSICTQLPSERRSLNAKGIEIVSAMKIRFEKSSQLLPGSRQLTTEFKSKFI